MKDFAYDNVRLIIGERNSQLRKIIRIDLKGRGFRDVFDTHKTSEIHEDLSQSAVDLLICDSVLADGDGAAGIFDNLTYKMRHHEIGSNPFVVAVTLIDAPTKEIVARAIDCGSDDVLVKPFSMGKLFERIQTLTRERKRFVVTSDYIGPDRRKQPRPGTQAIPQIDVPNPLKAKALGEVDVEHLQREIERVAQVLNAQKMERHAYQIAYLVDRIPPLYGDGTVDENVIPMLDRLLYVSRDITRRLEGTRFAHMGEICHSMADLAARVRRAPTSPDSQDLQDLSKLAEQIKRGFVLAELGTS